MQRIRRKKIANLYIKPDVITENEIATIKLLKHLKKHEEVLKSVKNSTT